MVAKRKIYPQELFLPIDNNNVLHKSVRETIYEDTKDFIKKISKN